MKIVIIGMGRLGKTILRNLSKENHTLTIIDEDRTRVESMIEKYDVYGVVGNGASMDIQIEAGVREADLAIVMTSNDELNILACLIAKQLGVKNTVTRVRNPDYRKQIVEIRDYLGISMIINPDRETANEIFSLISLPSVAKLERFAKGKASLFEIVVEPDCSLIGESLISLGKRLSTRILVCAVQRNGEVIIPSGNFVISEGDKLYITAAARTLGEFLAEAGLIRSRLKNVMIAGGGRIAFYLADELSQKKYKVKLIEPNPANAEVLADQLPRVTVVRGNGTEHDLLLEEGIEGMDAFIALTGIDEENMVVSMFSNKMKVKKTVALIKNESLYGMLGELGIHNTVSPANIVADRITAYVRALVNSRGSNVLNLYQLVNGQVEALEFAARTPQKFYDTPLYQLKIKPNCLIGCIIRKNEVIIPNGSSCIQLGDNVIVVTTHKNFDDLADVFI